MTPHVMKRDGCKVPFKSERIKEAILRAAKAAGVDDADYCATVAEVVSSQMNERSKVDINEIQTAVENQLMSGRTNNSPARTSNIATTVISSVKNVAV